MSHSPPLSKLESSMHLTPPPPSHTVTESKTVNFIPTSMLFLAGTGGSILLSCKLAQWFKCRITIFILIEFRNTNLQCIQNTHINSSLANKEYDDDLRINSLQPKRALLFPSRVEWFSTFCDKKRVLCFWSGVFV